MNSLSLYGKGDRNLYGKGDRKMIQVSWLKAITYLLFFIVVTSQVLANDYEIIIDDHNTPLPTTGQYYNATGGDRGLLNAGQISYQWDNVSVYTAKTVSNPGLWTWGGMWYSLIKINRDNIPLDFKAIFGSYVNSAYQGKIDQIKITVKGIKSPSKNSNLELRLELKKIDDTLVDSKTWNLHDRSYPQTLTWSLSEGQKQKVETILWVMDRAQVGDEVAVDSVKLKASVPNSSTPDQAFLWSYSWLVSNYNPLTGMVQDRSNFHLGDFENVTATGKLAKIVYYAHKKGFTTHDQAVAIITKIADTLIHVVPRGPVGKNTLWPHFTKNGGRQIVPNTEWSSGDTAYTALDVIVALQMIGDPQNQIGQLVTFLQKINWRALLLSGGISHGYEYNGNLKTSYWKGFGMETLGVNWAYASATGKVIEMGPPPTDNGSGFIDNVCYPIVYFGTDRWDNNWDIYRVTMANTQIGWYSQAGHSNSFLSAAGLFGLSAGENPEADAYVAYGVGGKLTGPQDGNHEVIVLHYSGMIADIKLTQAKQLWENLLNQNAGFLKGHIVISPLNNLESLRVNRTNGNLIINPLKGSWNLALQAEGWAMTNSAIKSDLSNAITKNAFLKRGYYLLKYKDSISTAWLCYY